MIVDAAGHPEGHLVGSGAVACPINAARTARVLL